jgi:hypothetical protein
VKPESTGPGSVQRMVRWRLSQPREWICLVARRLAAVGRSLKLVECLQKLLNLALILCDTILGNVIVCCYRIYLKSKTIPVRLRLLELKAKRLRLLVSCKYLRAVLLIGECKLVALRAICSAKHPIENSKRVYWWHDKSPNAELSDGTPKT